MAIEEFGRHVIDFVREHEAWAAPIVFSLAFAESLAFLSFVVPAWAVLVGVGAMMRSGGVAFIPVLLAGALGAALGDWLSYWLGQVCKHRIARMWPFSAHPTLLARGEASVPIAAGMLGMPLRVFQIANFTSALVWVAVLLVLGDFTGIIWQWLREVVGRFWT